MGRSCLPKIENDRTLAANQRIGRDVKGKKVRECQGNWLEVSVVRILSGPACLKL